MVFYFDLILFVRYATDSIDDGCQKITRPRGVLALCFFTYAPLWRYAVMRLPLPARALYASPPLRRPPVTPRLTLPPAAILSEMTLVFRRYAAYAAAALRSRLPAILRRHTRFFSRVLPANICSLPCRQRYIRHAAF